MDSLEGKEVDEKEVDEKASLPDDLKFPEYIPGALLLHGNDLHESGSNSHDHDDSGIWFSEPSSKAQCFIEKQAENVASKDILDNKGTEYSVAYSEPVKQDRNSLEQSTGDGITGSRQSPPNGHGGRLTVDHTSSELNARGNLLIADDRDANHSIFKTVSKKERKEQRSLHNQDTVLYMLGSDGHIRLSPGDEEMRPRNAIHVGLTTSEILNDTQKRTYQYSVDDDDVIILGQLAVKSPPCTSCTTSNRLCSVLTADQSLDTSAYFCDLGDDEDISVNSEHVGHSDTLPEMGDKDIKELVNVAGVNNPSEDKAEIIASNVGEVPCLTLTQQSETKCFTQKTEMPCLTPLTSNVILSQNQESISSAFDETSMTSLDLKNETSDYFEDLPEEMILKILLYLTPQELSCYVAPVCRYWYNHAYDPRLWKELKIDSAYNLSSLQLCRIIRKVPTLCKLVLRGRDSLSVPEVSIFTEGLVCLKEVDLGFCGNVNQVVLECFVENCPNLEAVNVEGCEKVNSDCVRVLSMAQKLKHFNFSHCAIADEDIIHLAETRDNIVSLNIDGISWLTDSCIILLVQYHKDHLQNLELDGAELSDYSFGAVSQCLELKKLGVSFCELLTDLTLEFIKELPSLHSLKLIKGFEFSNAGLCGIFEETRFCQLVDLNLSECNKIDDDCVIQVAKRCGKSLKHLAFCWCWYITDVGLTAIVDRCRNLIDLDLLGIYKIRGACLDRIPEEMLFLTYLNLQQCDNILDSVIVDVVRRKPDLKVLNYYGEEFVY